MSVTRVGATKKFADNWEQIFGGKKRPVGGKSANKSPKKKLTAKLSGKQRSAKKKARPKSR